MDVKRQAVLIFGMMTCISGWRPYNVKFLSVTHEAYHPEIVNLNTTLKNHSIIDVNFNLLRDMTQMFIDFEVTLDSGGGTFDLVYMNRTVDTCMFLKNKKVNIIVDIIYKILTAYGELPTTCPLQKRLYKLRNVFIDPEKFPPFLPDHKSRVVGVFWTKENNKKILLLDLKFFVVFERTFKNN